MRTVSIGTMIEQLSGMRDTGDLTDWENDFVAGISDRYERTGNDTRGSPACACGTPCATCARLASRTEGNIHD